MSYVFGIFGGRKGLTSQHNGSILPIAMTEAVTGQNDPIRTCCRTVIGLDAAHCRYDSNFQL
jgi:hypothetical protein